MSSGYIINRFQIVDGIRDNEIIKVKEFIDFWKDHTNDLFFNIIKKYLNRLRNFIIDTDNNTRSARKNRRSSRINPNTSRRNRLVESIQSRSNQRTDEINSLRGIEGTDTASQSVNYIYEVNVKSRCKSTKLICTMSLTEFKRMCETGYYDENVRHIVIPNEEFVYDDTQTIEENMAAKDLVLSISKSIIRQNRIHTPLNPNLRPQLESAMKEMNEKIGHLGPVNICTIAFKTINEYYLFIITLFVLDPLHDFRNGFRNNVICNANCKTKSELTRLKDNIKQFLNNKFEMIQQEWKYAMKTFNHSNEMNDDQYRQLSLEIGPYARELFTDTGLESKLINSINTLINNDSFGVGQDSPIELYRRTLDEIRTHSPKFILNNACSIANDLPVIDNGVFVTFEKTISERCKSNCATLYDGASGGVCGSLSKSFSGGGLEFGAYHIRYTYQDSLVSSDTEPPPPPQEYVDFICDYEELNAENAEIYQCITIHRKTARQQLVTTTHRFKIFDPNGNTDIVKVDDEILGYYDDDVSNSVDLGNIKSGDFGRIVKSREPCDVIHTCRKALCDFGQYLNSVIKGGGYYDMFYEKNIFPAQSGRTFKSQYMPSIPMNYPVLTMHTDQPATALNMLLLSTVPIPLVNDMAHTVYMTSANIDRTGHILSNHTYYFSNCNGSVCKLAVPNISGGGGTASRRRKGGTALMYGGEPNDFYRFCKDNEEKIKVFNILFIFFSYCITFQMPVECINDYNDFYDKYSNYVVEYTNVEFISDLEIIEGYNDDIRRSIRSPKSHKSSNSSSKSSSTPSKISKLFSPFTKFFGTNLFDRGGTNRYTKKYKPKYKKHTRKTYSK
jgi:hypothetical protein